MSSSVHLCGCGLATLPSLSSSSNKDALMAMMACWVRLIPYYSWDILHWNHMKSPTPPAGIGEGNMCKASPHGEFTVDPSMHQICQITGCASLGSCWKMLGVPSMSGMSKSASTKTIGESPPLELQNLAQKTGQLQNPQNRPLYFLFGCTS